MRPEGCFDRALGGLLELGYGIGVCRAGEELRCCGVVLGRGVFELRLLLAFGSCIH